MILIGYGGHAFVAYAIAKAMGLPVTGYCDAEEKLLNPYQLPFLGKEMDKENLEKMNNLGFFISIGNNTIRFKVAENLASENLQALNLIHPTAVVSANLEEVHGVMVAPNVVINPLAKIGNGVICNSASVVEHECVLDDFSHLAPGAILCGKVTVGKHSFIGAGSVVRPGIKIGSNVIIGAGSVVVKDIPDFAKVAGNPARPFI